MIARWMQLIHRVLGSVLSILFLMWFLSGLVMMYHTFPKVTRTDKLLRMSPLSGELPELDSVLRTVPRNEKIISMSLENYLRRTSFRIHTEKNIYIVPTDLSPDGGDTSAARILQIASLWNPSPVSRIDTLYKLDQWIPFGSLKKELPVYKFYFKDAQKHQLYLSGVTGNVLQYTSRRQRILAWLGPIPHWIYPTFLRQDAARWKIVVIFLSGAGTLMVTAGLYLGIRAYMRRKCRSGRLQSPYRKKWYKWHHITGTLFGIFVLTFIFSGMMSLASLPRWLVPVRKHYPVEQVLSGTRLDPADYRTDYRQIIKNYPRAIYSIAWSRAAGIPVYRILEKDETDPVLDASSDRIAPPEIPETYIKELTEKIFGQNSIRSISLQNEYDSYYIPRAGNLRPPLPLPVYKIRIQDADRSTLYISPSDGTYKYVNTRARWQSWCYKGLHCLKIPWLTRHPVLWEIIMWTLMIGGAALSLTSVVLAIKYIKRLFRRKTRSAHPD